ncbi:glycoside hydrolase superfamily [Obelidium mucronatum]|nr:glycoside hydrolase superfamily [Obelidium mucronatum]
MLLKNVVLLCASVSSALAATHSAIDYLWPAPQSVVDLNQTVAIKSFTVANLEFTDDPSIAYAFRQLNKSLAAKKASAMGSAAFPITVKITGKKVAGPAQLDGADESYSIKATSKGVVISAATQVGVVYGFQTLSQLVTADGQLVLANINDAPRFSYRGLLLDTGRNFFPKEDILRLLDGMVYSKLNVFHWHIFDSQSVPIKWDSYPQLYKSGGAFKNKDGSPKVYTEQDVTEIIEYAFTRGIRVIPEFSLPARGAAFANVNPAFISDLNYSPWDGHNADFANATNAPGVVWWGRQHCSEPPCGVLDVRKPEVVKFVDQLISEVGAWFKDPYLHTGHDGVNARNFKLVPDSWDYHDNSLVKPVIQAFEPKLLASLVKNKKKYAAWSYALDFGITIPKDSLISIEDPGAEIINSLTSKGYSNLVLAPYSIYSLDCSPTVPWCLDAYQSANPSYAYDIPGYSTRPGQWKNWTAIYANDPLEGVNQPSAVKGAFTMMWTETIKRHNLDRYVFPRASAAAERFWSYTAAPAFDAIKTTARFDRFRAALVNEVAIAAADLSYLGNKEEMVYMSEYCDGNTSAGQKTFEAGFVGTLQNSPDGSAPVAPYHYNELVDYCKITSLYNTDDLVYVKPQVVEYPY